MRKNGVNDGQISGLNMTSCPFCNLEIAESQKIHEYMYWNLFLQSHEKRQRTKEAAGFLATKDHVEKPELVSDESWLELKKVIPDATRRLCAAAGMAYRGSETVGFNQGEDAGQTVKHAHVHILPSTDEDPTELRTRGGIGGAFEALRKSRTNS